MSKILGIVAEYNPFHNGHLYHLKESKKITNADYTVAVISGNFTERGDTSLVNKWIKTEAALNNGIDLVIELPVLYANSSAENFADGAVKILNLLGVDYISFGSESDDIETFNKIATILNNEPKDYKILLSKELSTGISFPKARENALKKYLKLSSLPLSSPNNILGIEYLKSLKKHNSNIKPIIIKRYESNYNDLNYSGNIASATAIRNLIENKDYEKLKKLLPDSSYKLLMNEIKNNNIIPNLSCFEKEIIYSLRKMSLDEISNLPDVSEGLQNTIKKASINCNSLSDILNSIKSKRYTQTRIQRILLYALLGISKKDIELSKKVLPYIRVLGFNENGKTILSKILKSNTELKVITSVKKFNDSNTDKNLQTLLDKDILATNIYSLACNNFIGNQDFTTMLITKKITN